MKFVPEWVPGASFKRIGRDWREKVNYAKTLPFNTVKDSMVSPGELSIIDVKVLTVKQKHRAASQSAVLSMLENLDGKDAERSDGDVDEDTIMNVAGVAYSGEDTILNE